MLDYSRLLYKSTVFKIILGRDGTSSMGYASSTSKAKLCFNKPALII